MEHAMKKTSIESRLFAGLAVALVLLLLAGGQLYRSFQEYVETSRWIAHTYQVLDALGDVTSDIRELESGQRAYLITGQELYLAEHESKADRIQSTLARIAQLTADNPRQQLRSAALSQQAQQRLRLLDKTLAIYRAAGFGAARDHVKTGVSRISREALVKQVDAMEEEERTLLKQRSDQAESNASQALSIGALLVAVALAGFFLLWWWARREARERETAEAAVHENERLLTQILELIPVGVFICNAAGQLTRINPAAREIWAGDRMVGLEQYNEYEGWWPDTGKRIAADEWALARTLRNGETIRGELADIRCFDGSRKTITNNTTPIRDDGAASSVASPSMSMSM